MFRAALPYFGSVGLWSDALAAGGFSFRQNERYQRRSQRNRTIIVNAHGRQTLSLPLAGGRNQRVQTPEVRLNYREDWPRHHWLSLVAAYGSAPFWLDYAPELEALYQMRPAKLWTWNQACVQWTRDQVAPQLVLAKADDWQAETDVQEPSLQADRSLAPYPQVFAERLGWLSNVSILDLLLCQGPAAATYLSRSPMA